MTVWNTINDRYSNVVLYIEMKPHFLIFASFQSIFIMAEWNHIATYRLVMDFIFCYLFLY